MRLVTGSNRVVVAMVVCGVQGMWVRTLRRSFGEVGGGGGWTRLGRSLVVVALRCARHRLSKTFSEVEVRTLRT